MHEEGFKRALTSVLNAYGHKMKLLKDDEKVSGEDCREGLTCVISVKLTEAQFEGQTKSKLGNSEMRTLVNALVSDKLETFLEENPQTARAIVDKAMTASRAREAAKKARESIRRKTGLESGQMPDKLQDCNKSTLSRAIPPPVRRYKAVTPAFRRYSPCGAKCSTSRKPAPIRFTATISSTR